MTTSSGIGNRPPGLIGSFWWNIESRRVSSRSNELACTSFTFRYLLIYSTPFLLNWINFNPSMDKQSHTRQSVGWNYLYIPKPNGCAVEVHHWSLGIDKPFHPTLCQACDYFSILRLKLSYVSNRGHWGLNKMVGSFHTTLPNEISNKPCNFIQVSPRCVPSGPIDNEHCWMTPTHPPLFYFIEYQNIATWYVIDWRW